MKWKGQLVRYADSNVVLGTVLAEPTEDGVEAYVLVDCGTHVVSACCGHLEVVTDA